MIVTRAMRFEALRFHPMLGALFRRLSADDLKYCKEFIEQTKALSDDDFAFKVNRIDLDVEPKRVNATTIWSLLSQSFEPKVRRRR